jgi:hypothetical protein
MPLDPKQRHKLLMADRTKDVAWLRAAIKHLMVADQDVTLAEIEEVLRSAAGNNYLIGTPDSFEIVVGFTAWRDALGRLDMTAEMNRAVLAAEPIMPPATLP